MVKNLFLVLFLLVGLRFAEASVSDSTRVLNKKRLNTVIGVTSAGYVGSMIGLGTIWYEDLGRFHFFNDNDGWGYMDKIGHITTAQHVGRAGIAALRWTGLEEKKAIWYGGSIGLVFLTSVEIFDGLSEEWGFSPGDFVANALGAGLAIGQESKWKEQRILTKWSYQASPYAQYRPELLGESGSERWLKDYNGQTYWLSLNLKSTLLKNSNLPPWLNMAVGYSIEGYVGANRNPTENSDGELIPHFERYGQVYLSPDIDLSKIPTTSKFLRTILDALNFIKVPMPAIEHNRIDGFSFHWFQF